MHPGNDAFVFKSQLVISTSLLCRGFLLRDLPGQDCSLSFCSSLVLLSSKRCARQFPRSELQLLGC